MEGKDGTLTLTAVPEGCQCCTIIKTQVVCNTCNEPKLVECNAADPDCFHYSDKICMAAGNECPAKPAPAPPPYVPPQQCAQGFDACSVSGSKFNLIELEWTGNVMANDHAQEGKRAILRPRSRKIDTVNGGSLVKPVGKKLGINLKWTPSAGDVLAFNSADLNGRYLPSKFAFKVDKGKFAFTVNCKKAPLRIGDQFGPFTVIGFETQHRDSTCLSGRAAALGQSDLDSALLDSSNTNGAVFESIGTSSSSGSGMSTDSELIVGIIVTTVLLVVAIIGAVVCRDSTHRDADAAFNGVLEPEDTEIEPSLPGGETETSAVQILHN